MERLPAPRCFSCNRLLQPGWDALAAARHEDVAETLRRAGYARVCCARMLLTQPLPLAPLAPAAPLAPTA